MDQHRLDWDKKEAKVYFRGALTGTPLRDENNQPLGRLKLAQMSLQHPDDFDVTFTFAQQEDDAKDLPPGKVGHNKQDLCEITQYKYMITVDGNVSPWARGAQMLYSESVPLIAESGSQPLYQTQWVPWVHYVPVKNDLSDLLE